MRYKRLVFVSCFIMIFTCVVLTSAETGNPQETLKQYMSDLQKNPDDFALREKIIKLVQGMTPQPAIPQDAKRPFMKGVTFMKEATSASDYDLTIKAFKEALLIAPWWPEAYYNLALAQEAAGKFDDGIRNLKLYLLTNPKDKEDAENKMYALEAKKEKAAVSKVQEAAEKKKREEDFIRNLAGTWVKEQLLPDGQLWWETFYEYVSKGQNSFELRFKYKSKDYVTNQPGIPPIEDYYELTIQEGKVSGRNYIRPLPDSWCKKNTGYFIPVSGTIAADSRSMVLTSGAHKSIMANCKWQDSPGGYEEKLKKR